MDLKEIIKMTENGESLSESTLWKLLDFEIERELGEESRWSRSVYSIIKIEGRFFGIYWEKGATECQESYIEEQVLEEIKKVREVIEVERWVLV